MTIIPEDLEIHKPNKLLKKKMDDFEIEEKMLFKIDSTFHSISVVENNIGRFLKYNETYQAGYINTKSYQGNLPYINYFLIPYLINPNIKSILLVGFGSGYIINQFEKLFKKLDKIDVVDIEENIFDIAEKYFDFKKSEKTNFYLQDALIYLKETKRKYDLIIVDVAGDEGIDERFCDINYLQLIKKHLKKDGVFVSNLPSSRDIFNPKNKFINDLLKDYKKTFSNITLFNGEQSNKVFYKTFFNIDDIVLDITNLIIFSSDKKYAFKENVVLNQEIKSKIKLDIREYLKDKINE